MGNKIGGLFKIVRMNKDRFLVELLISISFISGMVLKCVPLFSSAITDADIISEVTDGCSFIGTVSSAHSSTIGLGESVEDFGSTKITTVCATSADHQIYAVGYTNNIEGNTDLVNVRNNLIIPTGVETGNVSNWSMKIAKDTASYQPDNLTLENGFNSNHIIPSTITKISSYTGGTDNSIGSSIFTTYSARASRTQTGGLYTGKVKFTLVATMTYSITVKPTIGIQKITLNDVECSDTAGCVIPNLVSGTSYNLVATAADGYIFTGWNATATGTIADNSAISTTYEIGDGSEIITANAGPVIQNIDSSDCTSIATTFYDVRDGHAYEVQRLNDGNCWMMRNLDLGHTELTADLTPTNTNLVTTVTASTFNSWKKTSGSATYDAGEYISVSGTDATSGTPYGTLYNYYATSAGTISGSTNSSNASYDICPAGWRLPTGGSSGEFQTLYTQYNSNALMRAPIANGGTAFALAGYFGGSTPVNQGISGVYWSSTRSGDAGMYNLILSTGGVYPASNDARYGGYAIRCVLKKQITDLDYLQDFNGLSADDKASVLASMEDSTAYTLIDNRDNKSYAIAKMKDGKIWMAENLDLGRTALTTDLTSANTNLSTTVTAATFNGWKKTSGTGTYDAGEFINVTGTDSTSGTPYGTLYNYYSASAGTITGSANSNDATHDICPAGWRLPTGGYSGEFQVLYAEYNSNALMRASIANGGTAFALAGGFGDSTPATQGSNGNYWSSTRYSNTYMYNLSLGTSSVYPAVSYFSRSYGGTIRCVVKNPSHTLSVTYGTGVTDVTINGISVANGGTMSLEEGVTYHISTTLSSNYSFTSWSATSGTVGSVSTQTTTYIIGTANATLTAAASFTGTYIQNLSASSCTTTASTVYDSRDMHAYTIQRLADGKCWMMENLDLGRTTLTTDLTSTNTNLSTTVTASTFNSWKKNSGTATNTAGEFISVSGSDATSGTPYGTLYNYYAASAGTISGSTNSSNASYDICPAGWRLPTGGSSGEFQALYAEYNSNALMRASIENNGAAFALAGLFYSNTPASQGSYGYYWSSTRNSNTYMYSLSLNTSNVYPANGDNRNGGLAIRCVLDEPPTILDLTYMQDFNGLSADDKASVLASMEDSTAYTLIDNRDNKSYAIAKMKDGKIWMAENLDLGRTALTTDLTSANTNLSTTVTAATFNGWKKTSGTGTYDAGEFINVTGTDSTSGTPYGTLYNFYAASAGTISGDTNSSNASYDICPAGWRLPTGGSSGEFQALYTEYNSNALMRAPIANGGTAFALAGYFSRSTPANQGSDGYYWSSTRYNNTAMHDLSLGTVEVTPADAGYRSGGEAIRCVVK